jgi:membrane protein DedA with SNARE-associated domain
VSLRSLAWARRKAPQLILAAIAIVVAVIVLLEILEDVLVEGTPLTGGSLLWLWNTIILITRNTTAAVASWGYAGIFAFMLLESSSLPIPSEVVLPFAGYLVSLGQLNFWGTVAVATIAGITGSLIDYYIGYKGWNFINERRILGRVLFSKSQFDVAVGWFHRHGTITVFLSRLVPGFRTIVSFPAGAVRMPLAKFVAYTTTGCLIWNGLLVYFGYFLGSQWTQVAGVSHYLIIVSVVALMAILVSYLFSWQSRAKRTRPQDPASTLG